MSDKINLAAVFKPKSDQAFTILTEFEESAFESIAEYIVVINQIELEFHMIGGLKLTENM